MTKSELITEMSNRTNMNKKDCADALEAFQEVVKDELIKGERVQLIGFGSFEVAERAERIGRNPKTSEEILIPASKAPKFKFAKTIRDAIKNS